MFFYHSDVKETSGMLNIHFGLALIDTLDLIEEAFIISVFVIIEFFQHLFSTFPLYFK